MQDSKETLGRRTVLAGTATAGALAATAALLPKAGAPDHQAAVDTKALPDTAAGYRLTEHVKRYYKTARI